MVKKLPANTGDIRDVGSVPDLGRCLEESMARSIGSHSGEVESCYFVGLLCGKGNGTPLQYSCLENPMDGGAWLGCSPWGRKSRT